MDENILSWWDFKVWDDDDDVSGESSSYKVDIQAATTEDAMENAKAYCEKRGITDYGPVIPK